jgi:hypothetical protein
MAARGATTRKERKPTVEALIGPGGWTRLVALAALAGIPTLAGAADPADKAGFRVDASYTSDDNVNRGPAGDALKDWSLGLRGSVSGVLPVSTHTRAIVQAFAGTERFQNFNGLSRNFIGVQGDFQYRASGEFGRPIYGAFYRIQGENYESTLRDGTRSALGVSVLKPLTDRVNLLAALTENITDGSSTVFDTRSTSLRGNVDWALGNRNLVYLGAEYRHGDSVSSVCRTCDLRRTTGLIATAGSNIVQDDAFDDTVRDAYKIKANTWVFTLGYNLAITGGQSLDLSWRRVLSKGLDPVAPAIQSDINYYVTQYSLAYLARF